MTLKCWWEVHKRNIQFSCRYGYLKIADENSREVGKYCGVQFGKEVFLFGKYAVLTLKKDAWILSRFRIVFAFIQLGKCNEILTNSKGESN